MEARFQQWIPCLTPSMSTGWLAKQNEEPNLRRIVAATNRYDRAKAVVALQVIALVVVPILLACLRILEPSASTWVALYGTVAAIVDIAFVDRWYHTLLKQGALCQELFDCDVLGLSWNAELVDPEPGPDQVVEWALASQIEQRKQLANWYPVVAGTAPIEMGRLICQLSSCGWDSHLRRRYAFMLGAGAITCVLVVLTVSVAVQASVESFVFAAFTLLPAVAWSLRSWRAQSEALELADRQRNHVLAIWRDESAQNQAEVTFLHGHAQYKTVSTLAESSLSRCSPGCTERSVRETRRQW